MNFRAVITIMHQSYTRRRRPATCLSLLVLTSDNVYVADDIHCTTRSQNYSRY